jgi:hypothetical protein
MQASAGTSSFVVDVLAQQPLAVGDHVADEAVEVLRRAVGADLAAHGNTGGIEQVQPAAARHARAADHRRLVGDRHDRACVGVAEVLIGRVRTGIRQRQPRGEDSLGAEHGRALPCRGGARRPADACGCRSRREPGARVEGAREAPAAGLLEELPGVAAAGVDVEILDRRVTNGVIGHLDASCAASAASRRTPRRCAACRASVPARGSTDQGRAGEKSPANLA